MGKRVDLKGQTFGMLRVLAPAGNHCGRALWLCLCECGAQRTVRGEALRSGNTSSCGCKRTVVARAAREEEAKTPRATCKTCGVEKEKSDFYRVAANKSGLSIYCKQCHSIRCAAYIERVKVTAPPKLPAIVKPRVKDRSSILKRQREWRARNRQRFNEVSRQRSAKDLKELSDSYVRGLIRDDGALRGVDIPRELIEAKRLHILVRRNLKRKHP